MGQEKLIKDNRDQQVKDVDDGREREAGDVIYIK